MMNIDSIPNEILQQIFIHLSHRNRAQCSLVNKKWYSITRQPLFYKTIAIYNTKQLEKFIHIATTFFIHNHLVGHYVERLLLESYYIGRYYNTDITLIRNLNIACPNVTYIYTAPTLYSYRSFDFPLWPKLQILPVWVQKRDKDWFQRLCNKKNQYTSLECELRNNMLPQPSHTTAASEADDTEPEKEKENDAAYIFFKKDQNKQLRKLIDYPIAKRYPYYGNRNNNQIEIINDEEYINYSGTIIFFSTKIKPNFLHLKELSLDFKQDLYRYCYPITAIPMEIDERTLENIHQVCPVLESLTLQNLILNISNHYLQHKKLSSSSIINICTSLKKLSLLQISIQHPNGCLQYFSEKYPQLTTLTMDLVLLWSDELNSEFQRQFKLATIDMITHYSDLASLSIQLIRKEYDACESVYNRRKHFWSNTGFLEWLSQHPTQLTSLTYPLSFHDIENDYDSGIIRQCQKSYSPYSLEKLDTRHINEEEAKKKKDDDDKEIKQHYVYLDHLKTLVLQLESNLNSTYNYLLLIKKSQYASFSNITSLDIEYRFLSDTMKKVKGAFYFYSWLNLFPNLKKLQLENIQRLDWDYTHDDMDDGLTYAGDMIYLEKEERLMTSNGKISSQVQLNDLFWRKHQHQGPFPLVELILTKCRINGVHGLTHICRSCPSLRILKLKNVKIAQHQDELNDQVVSKLKSDVLNDGGSLDYDVLIDASHLLLDRLHIDQCVIHDFCTGYNYQLEKLIIQESKNDTTSTFSSVIKRRYHARIVVNCKYVDWVYFI